MLYLGKARRFFDELSSTVLFVFCDTDFKSGEAILLVKDKIAAVVNHFLAIMIVLKMSFI